MVQIPERLHKVTKVVFKCTVFTAPEVVPHPSDKNIRTVPSLFTCVKFRTTSFNRSIGIRNC